MNSVSKVNRIKHLFNLQRTEKFKFTKSTRSIIYNVIFKTVLVGAVSYLLFLLLSFLRSTAAFPLTYNVLGLFIMVFCLLSFFSAFSTINNYLYKASDNEFLFAMPATNGEVYLSKMLIVLLQEFLSSLTFLLPMLIAFGLAIDKGGVFSMTLTPHYYVASVLMLIFLPFLPIALAMLASILYRLFIDFVSRYTALVVIVAVGLITGFLLILNAIASIFISNINIFDQIFYLSARITDFINNLMKSTFIFSFIAQIFVGHYLNFLYFVLIVIGLFLGGYFLVKPFYFKLVLSPAKRKKSTKVKASGYRQHNTYVSIFKKECIELFGDMSSFFKYFTISLIAPVLVLIIDKIFGSLDLRHSGLQLVLGSNFMVIGIFIMMGCLYVLNAISGEGKNLYIQQISPVSYRKYSTVKILINYFISELILLACSIIMASTTKLTFGQGLGMFISLSILLAGHLLYCYRLELSNPLLDWHDAAELQKNKNVGKGILNALIVAIIYGGFAIKFFYIAKPINAWIYLILIAALYTAYQFVLLKFRYNYYTKNLSDIKLVKKE